MSSERVVDDATTSSAFGDVALLRKPIQLPCGKVVPNRLVKAALYEGLATWGGGPPNPKHFKVYSNWGKGGWGMVITGNVQIDARHLSLGRDLLVPEELTPETIAPFAQLSQCIKSPSTEVPLKSPPLAIIQLNHTSRQAPRIVGGRGFIGRASAPSAVRLASRNATDGLISRLIYRLLFPTPKELTEDEIDVIIESFVRGARLAVEAGFDGVQIHASHGYLLALFLSPKTNLRSAPYGFPNELNIVKTIVTRIREAAPKDFVVGIKVNAADYVKGGITESRALEHVKEMASWGMLDFIEISGGDYERPDFTAKANPRQAFFESFARLAADALPKEGPVPLVMLTGSLRTRTLMAKIVRAGHAELLGVGRPAVIYPAFPEIIFDPTPPSSETPDSTTAIDALVPNERVAPVPEAPSPGWLKLLNTGLIGAGINIAWHCALMWRVGTGQWNGLRPTSGKPMSGDTTESAGQVIPKIGGIRSMVDLWRP